MEKKISAPEIVNPKLTRARREADAGLSGDAGPAPVGGLVPSSEKTGQDKFLYGPKSKPKSAEDEARRRRNFLELQRKRDAEIKASSNQFEEEFSRGSDAPLTDSVRAARKAAVEPAMEEDAEYASAYNEEQKRAA